jgi:hypothetical protein
MRESHLDQECFDPRETLRDWLHDGRHDGGHDGLKCSATLNACFRHADHFTRTKSTLMFNFAQSATPTNRPRARG